MRIRGFPRLNRLLRKSLGNIILTVLVRELHQVDVDAPFDLN